MLWYQDFRYGDTNMFSPNLETDPIMVWRNPFNNTQVALFAERTEGLYLSIRAIYGEDAKHGRGEEVTGTLFTKRLVDVQTGEAAPTSKDFQDCAKLTIRTVDKWLNVPTPLDVENELKKKTEDGL
ncbi:hypothetical protein [Corynebacterium amycolatum]|uniref:hypothetical protein n=1 Tax=Corynebacterium amycolatum TaxID=43765 RepID=UPI0012B736CB|nr:hypothetical protein [Corynebacterium amycolatum]KAA9285631.1 hypothetical protein F6I11_10495 [Corynebacterium amycolatum]